MRVGPLFAKNGSACMGQKISRVPKSLLPAGDLCQFQQLLSLVCSGSLLKLPNRHTSAAILMVFLLLFCDGFIFCTCLTLFGYSQLETVGKHHEFGVPIFRGELRASIFEDKQTMSKLLVVVWG